MSNGQPDDARRVFSSGRTLGLLLVPRHPLAELCRLALHAEATGLACLWIPDERFFREVYVTCADLAHHTSRVLLGPCVTDPFSRHAAMTAAAIATIDEATGGRAVLGIGAGVSGFEEMHLERRHVAVAVGEAVDLVRTLLSGARATRTGLVVRFDGSLDFTPLRPGIPLFVAAGGPRMLRTAGTCADGVILQAQATAEEFEISRRRIHEAARSAGRTPERLLLVARLDVAIQQTREHALQLLRPRAARILSRSAPTFRRFHELGLEITDGMAKLAGEIAYTHDSKTYEALGELMAPEFINAVCVAATPETLGGQLATIFSWGVDHIIVHPILPSGSSPVALHAFIDVLATAVS